MMRIVVWDEPARIWLFDHWEDEDGLVAPLSWNLEVPWFGVSGGDGNGFCSSSSLCTVTIFLADAQWSQHQRGDGILGR